MKHSIKLMLAASALACFGSAQAEIVVIVNAKHSASSMTAEEVANVFLGKSSGFAPADLPEQAGTRDEFYKKVTGKDLTQVKSMWARLIFTSNAQPPKQMSSAEEAVKFVASNDKGIAYVEKAALDPSVKAVLTIQ
jgi:ABC-type phosphate transport system substrate-binding protein